MNLGDDVGRMGCVRVTCLSTMMMMIPGRHRLLTPTLRGLLFGSLEASRTEQRSTVGHVRVGVRVRVRVRVRVKVRVRVFSAHRAIRS